MGFWDRFRRKEVDEPLPLEMRKIGFWRTRPDDPEGLLGYPHPASLVDRSWEADRRGRIVDFLRGGHTLAAYLGFSFCRFDDCHLEHSALGTRDFTDGRWVWPEGLGHYVANHGVRLPDAFIADAATHRFVVPRVSIDSPVRVDVGFWLRWVAENTAPTPAQLDACSLDEAQAICAKLSTRRWRASASAEHGRWKLRMETQDQVFEDYTGSIADSLLLAYLFRYRLSDAESLLDFEQAAAIAREYESDAGAARPFALSTAEDGQTWWALITSTRVTPPQPFEELDFAAIQTQIPQPGMALFLPGGWKVEVALGMDEPAWRFFLEDWRRGLVLSAEARDCDPRHS